MAIVAEEVVRAITKCSGIDITATFTNTETGQVVMKTMYFGNPNPSSAEVTERFNHNAERMKFKLNPLNYLSFDGDDVQPVLRKMVQYIHNHPECTKDTLKTAAETQFPNLFWKVDVLIDKTKAELRKHFGYVPTFEQFKTYVVNHKFVGVDE